MMIGTKGLDLIKSFEKLRLQAYKDSGGVWTDGWGHTGKEIIGGYIETKEKADADLIIDLVDAETWVSKFIKVELNQDQFDALTSFVYNCGAGNFSKSTLRILINGQRYLEAAEQFPHWNKVDGNPVAGLTRRRNAERALFLSQDYTKFL